jgi:hypothetical protein
VSKFSALSSNWGRVISADVIAPLPNCYSA